MDMKHLFPAFLSVALIVGCGDKVSLLNDEKSPASKSKLPPKKPGTVLWIFETENAVASSPAIGSEGTVYVGSMDKKVYALDGKTGGKKWAFETGRYVFSSPVLGLGGILYVGSSDKKVYAIKTSSKGLAKSPWPMRCQNAQHTGRAP